MKEKIKVMEVVIDGITYVPKDSIQLAPDVDGMPFVCVRTYSAGVHCGYLKSQVLKEVVLLKAIRIHYWKGAASLSQLAMEGIKNIEESRIAMPVIWNKLTEAIETIKMTDIAASIIQNNATWKV